MQKEASDGHLNVAAIVSYRCKTALKSRKYVGISIVYSLCWKSCSQFLIFLGSPALGGVNCTVEVSNKLWTFDEMDTIFRGKKKEKRVHFRDRIAIYSKTLKLDVIQPLQQAPLLHKNPIDASLWASHAHKTKKRTKKQKTKKTQMKTQPNINTPKSTFTSNSMPIRV